MVYVPAGEFQMGSEDGEENEKPVHTVYLDAFWIDQTEVTTAMYGKCVDAGVCDLPSSTKSSTRDSYYGNSEYNDYPVIYVFWNDTVTYCEWADRRLPTEAEWEKAASWNEETQAKHVYPWGDSIDCSQANYGGCVGDTTIVGSYENGKSSYFAYDMGGNVSELVSSLYKSYPYHEIDGREDLTASGLRVVRGGTWNYSNNIVRSTRRNGTYSSRAYDNIGFRCAHDATP